MSQTPWHLGQLCDRTFWTVSGPPDGALKVHRVPPTLTGAHLCCGTTLRHAIPVGCVQERSLQRERVCLQVYL
jgi:hypothetical protein